MKCILSVFLVVVMVFSMLPSNVLHLHAQAAENIQPQTAENPLKGKTLSILGASISTFAGTSNGVAADTTNSTIRNNVKYYPNSTIPEVNLNDTWWMQVVQDLELRLLVNNAWSGSAILLERSGTVGAYVDRCVQLHDDTGDNAGEEPDIICIQMGFNDFSYGKETLGTADIDYDALITQDGYAIPATTMEATAIMLDKMVKRYPNAEIYMFNHFKRVGQGSSDTALMEELNASIATVCARFGVTVVDLYTTLTEEAHIGDGRLHPNRLGMDAISEAVKTAILSSYPEAAAHTVSLDRNRVTADYVDHKIVLDGDSFTLNLTAEADLALDVKVTMGGKDITDSAYANGTVSIDAVTGDVKITAQAIYSPQNYRWEFDGTDLKCVSGGNDLTKNAGTTENGVFDKTRYALEQAVVLQHDLPWIVEWKSEGSWKNSGSASGGRMFTSDDVNAHYNARYIFKSSTNGLIAMGEKTTTGSYNYGIALADHGIDASAPHTYRLENRIAADGSNMIWLYVDGDEIGPMNHYYIGTADQKTTSDWLSGKDFAFPYMGTDTHGLTNCAIDHIAVWEGGDVASDFAGKTIVCIGDSITAGVGVTKDQTDYVTLLAKALEMDYIRLGASGTTLCTDGHATCNIGKLTEANLANADVVTILMGINDFVQARNDYYRLGTIDSTDTSTIYGAVHMWCQRIQELRKTDSLKHTEFYFMTPVITSWNNSVSSEKNWDQSKTNIHGYTLRDLCNAIVEVCALYDISVIDLNLISGLYYNSAEDNSIIKFGGDGAHPGTEGHQMMAAAIKKALLQSQLQDGHNHSYGSWITTTYPDCEDGEQQRVCSVCTVTEKRIAEGLGHTYENGICIWCAEWNICWEVGTIAAANGGNNANSTRIRTVDHLRLSDFAGVCVNAGYQLTWLAYDADKNYIGNGTFSFTGYWQPSGQSIATADIQALYADAVYFRLALKAVSGGNMTLEDAERSGVTFVPFGQALPEPEFELEYENSINIGSWQDGAIWNGNLFVLGASGTGAVYDLENLSKLATFSLDSADVLKPHANSVCFGSTYYAPGDEYPLLYVNVYNNYASAEDRKEGICCVYRISKTDGGFITELVQVIRIGFVEDLSLWKSKENNGDVRPYGNFLVDTDANKLYAYVMRDASKATRFFKFDLPELTDGIYSETYGCNVVTLGSADIEGQFDTEYFNYLQGGTYSSGMILSAEGFNSGSSAEPAIRIIDLQTGTVSATYYMANSGLTTEPEVVCIDPATGLLYYAPADGTLRILTIPDVHFHTYENGICTGCGAEEPNAGEQLSLRYDDRYDVTGKEVEIIDAGTPTSYKVGFGVAPGTPDDAVITHDGGKLIATGIGTARVRIDGIEYEITVTAAPISLILLAGQSNMQGSEGDANQSIICPDGMVYSTYGDRYTMNIDNATNFAPSALTGAGSAINVNGTTANLADWPVYLLNAAGTGKAGPDSGFAYEWVKQTGEKVWIVNAAHGGTSISVWQPGTTEYMECFALFTACQEVLRQEIAAGHFTLSHMGYFWCQGCTDRTRSAQWYVEKYLTMHNTFKTEMAFDHDSNPATADKTFEFGGIIPVRVGSTTACYRDGTYAVANPYAYHESFVDLRFSGPRVAQYWLGNNPDLPDIHVVCTIGESWVWMPDGTNGVSDYFQAHYENGRVDYTPQVAQKESWYTPTTPKAVHDSIHYNQIGYNEIGRESVRNMLYILGVLEAPEAETTVKFVGWDGFTEITDITAATTGSSATLVVPMIYPLWKAKEVTYQLTDGLTWNYYDLLAGDLQTTGTLTAVGFAGSVTVNKAQPGQLYADHLSVLPEDVCCGLNLWPLLTHDPQYYASGTHWGVYSGGNVCSVTIPVQAGDMLYASSWGKAGENGHATSNGIRVTVFGAYGVVKTMDPAGTYKEFTANGGFLVMPEGATAINIAMWTDDPQWEIYILSREHDTADGICGICGKDTHVHSFSDWQTVTLPSQDGPGVEKRSCACGETESRQVDGVWQKYDLSAHMSALPEGLCCGLNLWPLLEHDPYYFASGTAWGKYSGGSVCSVTIPVSGGDRILASSFGVAGGNGHATTSGIRVTFFGVYGVLKTMTPAEVYAELLANDCLIAPEGAVAVNVPMWTNSDEWHLYILNWAHSFGVWTQTDSPTCTEKGSERRDCANCDHFETRDIDAKGHSYSSKVTAPTCTDKGYTTYTCACGHNYVADYVDATGHDYNIIGIVDPTCTEPGENHYRCVGCGDQKTEAGEPATGHKLGTWEVVKQPTCTEKGKEERKCANCDYSETRDIAAKGHNYSSKVTAPTCTDKGYTTYTCACGHNYVADYVDATGHDYNIIGIVDPTCTEPGENHYRCAGCGDQKTEVGEPATGHKLGTWEVVKQPTCTEKGKEERKCANCDYSETRDIAMTDHRYQNGACADCGQGEPGFLWGDVNGDDYVDSDDAYLLLMFDAELLDGTALDLACADVSGDGYVDSDDAYLILMFDAELIDRFPGK